MASNPLSQVLSAPLGDIISEMGMGIAQAQYAIDAKTIENMKMIYSLEDDVVKELRNIGYRPSWYVIPEAHAEINIALTVGQTNTRSGTRKTQLFGATVDASYQNQYDYKMQASSTLKIKFAPVPAPVQMDSMEIVPNIIGMSFASAKIILARLGLEFSSPANMKDNTVITKTTPAAGEFIESETAIALK
jgi:hypothetical protein